ncbi:MAG: hypothetical protein IPM02_04170 [Betaproteobacteria bacterium]|nr:hypothetical protein [Betaproteobacteria bacterium]
MPSASFGRPQDGDRSGFFMQATATGKPKLPSLQLLVSGLIALAASAGAFAVAASTGARLASIGVPFIANQGQVDSRVSFYARTFAGTVFVTGDGRLVYSLAGSRQQPRATPVASHATVTGWTLSESFTTAPALPVGMRPAAARVSSFVGPAAATRPDLPTYESVGLGEVAHGISLEVRTAGNNIEKLFQVAPGADVRGIRARIDGAEGVSLAADGGLIIATGLGAVQFTAPVAYQERGGIRTLVPVRYELAGGTGYGFATGDYDRSLPLIIDPLIRSTFSGGNGEDAIRAMLVHPGSGDVYVAGSTTSTNFPGTGTGAQTANPSGTDAFVARYNAGLTNLVRASYYGATNATIANAIAILPLSGDIYIAGTTSSASGLLNMTGTLSGTFDAFIARFDGALSNVLSARYYGGSGDEEASGLAIDNLAGDVIVAGATTSSDLTLGSGTTSTGGGQDAFVAKFSANLAALTSAVYFGGSGTDRALAVARDPLTGDIVLAGVTDSVNLTGTANGALPAYGGGISDGFTARFNSTLATLLQSTYFGDGHGPDQCGRHSSAQWPGLCRRRHGVYRPAGQAGGATHHRRRQGCLHRAAAQGPLRSAGGHLLWRWRRRRGQCAGDQQVFGRGLCSGLFYVLQSSRNRVRNPGSEGCRQRRLRRALRRGACGRQAGNVPWRLRLRNCPGGGAHRFRCVCRRRDRVHDARGRRANGNTAAAGRRQ